MKKKILVVLTNVTQYGNLDEPTGLWLGEATEFVEEVTKAGYEVDYVSPNGGWVPLDPRGMKYVDESIMTVYNSKDFQDRALTNSLSPKEIKPSDYDVIYYTGGHGVMWDFPESSELQNISNQIYKQGGILSSVCHGIAGLLNIKDDNGQYLINGRRITGFTKSEEILAGKLRKVPFLNQEVAEEHGATFMKKRFYKDYAIQDGQFITGQNPFSARSVGKLVAQALNNKQ